MKSINILGTDYKIEIRKMSEDSSLKDNQWAGYCDEDAKLIVIADFDENEYFTFEDEESKDEYFKKTLRHEVLHAFLSESGLSYSSMKYSSGWAKNEEMVDWFAIQFPKIQKAYREVGCL